MPFKSILDYHHFNEFVQKKGRYRFGDEHERFLRDVDESGRGRAIRISAGTILYRAQRGCRIEPWGWKGCEGEIEGHKPHERIRMIPRTNLAAEGRVNPKGIPCLYLAEDAKTAMSEMRSWIAERISLGSFRTTRELSVIDCTAGRILPKVDGGVEETVWGEISHAFSRPVNPSDETGDYATTQILSEVFKRMGCDGVRYRSLLGESGNSIALFDVQAAKMFYCELCRTTQVQYQFSAEGKSYWVPEDGLEIECGEPPIDESPEHDESVE